jgi:two-component system OmpR family sensor kinase
VILITIIAYLYYEKEIDREKRVCKKDLQHSIIKVEAQLLKAKLNQERFIFKASDFKLGVGLFNKEREAIFSSLKYPHVNFHHHISKYPHYIHMVEELQKPIFDVYYIVAEDTTMPITKKSLLTLIMIVILLSFIFIAFIGYLLSQILLQPVKEKMSQLDKFIKDSAHEINTPIAALLMSVSALKKKGIADEKILNHISLSSKQISDIYNSLSHLAFDEMKMQREIERVEFKELVEKSVTFYKELAKTKAMQLIMQLENTPIMIDKSDATKLINNLLSNAVKYNQHGKNISITLKNNILTVKDEGIGMDEKEKKVLLTRYYRGSNLQGGFGIGLDIINSIASRYHLKLEIRSKKGQGSQFSLDFSSIVAKT